jgi:hypothetical protein
MHRAHGGWQYISYAMPVLHFFIPFLAIVSRHVKRNRKALAAACIYFLVVHALDLYWMVMPNVGGHGAEPHLEPHLVNFLALMGVIGVFLAAFGFFLNKNRVLCVGDPRLAESMAHENY